MKAMRPVSASNGVPYLQMRSVGSHSESGRKCRLDAPRPAVPVNRRTWKVSITLLATSSGHVQYYRNKTKSLAPVLDPATSYPYSEQIFRRPSGACRSACSGVYKPASRQTDLVIDIIQECPLLSYTVKNLFIILMFGKYVVVCWVFWQGILCRIGLAVEFRNLLSSRHQQPLLNLV